MYHCACGHTTRDGQEALWHLLECDTLGPTEPLPDWAAEDAA